MPGSYDDADELSIRFSYGDPEIIERLYQEHKPAISRHVALLTSDPVHTEVILREVHLRVWWSAHRYEVDKSSLYRWILTIADQTAKAYLEAQGNSTHQP